jgi:hypothetical protein
MKYRQQWIEKRYPSEVKKQQPINMLEDDEFE